MRISIIFSLLFLYCPIGILKVVILEAQKGEVTINIIDGEYEN
jgi:hypothetical protein